jgi:corrinoid protein of di/trimethylamine methyltransferase
MSEFVKEIYEAVYNGDEDQVAELAQKAIDEGLDANTVINEGGVAALSQLGEEFDRLEVFLPELMMAGEAMKKLVEIMSSTFDKEEGAYNGKVIIGTASGDLHDIGMNLVAIQLAVHGYEVINMGTDVSVGEYIDKANEENADIIAVSSLLTTSAYYQRELVERLEQEGLREKFKVIVGGGPITPDWTRQIKADGYSRTANLAVKLCNQLVSGEKPAEEPIIVE